MTTKEAIERINARFDKWALDNDDLTALQALGLANIGSNDERIRKRLIDCLKFSLEGAEEQDAAGCNRQKDIEAYKWGIAYLEKQPTNEEMLRTLRVEYEKGVADTIAKYEQKEQKRATLKPHKGDDDNPYDMGVSEAQEYAINRGFGVPFNDGEVYVDERHMTQTIGNIIRWADEHPKERGTAEWSEEDREEDLQTRFAFYTYKDEDDVLYLSNVFVEETSRNKGLGTNILAAAEKVAETLGIITIRLKVKRDSPANAWYRKHGYGYMTFEDGYDWLEKTLEYLKPIKQEWSDSDDKMLKSIIEDSQNCHILGVGQIDWIKSLRPQPNQEWSEEDEEMFACIIDDVKEINKTKKYKHQKEIGEMEIDWLKNRLKSLRPHPHWKPSEYTLSLVKKVASGEMLTSVEQMAIGTLHEQLKKL